ncbi:fimbrial biogenesis outer membrane usher protein [Pseudomonas sp. Milli4]|uniref:Fimbrial biogenesis outer membrane usher protein n=2 Tax=Pseudomonas schmalbachii TaxID=2816993 RepID=A0ABS3TTQ2_9PSED|nr:fimbria/pilus outer membrane usher protein [Pseudomonas schmalbachii]MBO3277026.1 fimbrial biogenesis outer membrane usher protein [Pseudomonas schmalbachii]
MLICGTGYAAEGGELLGYSFDDSLLMGTPLGGGRISRFNQPNQVDPGVYNLDLYANNDFIARTSVEFRQETPNGPVVPCFSDSFLLKNIGVLPEKLANTAGQDEQAGKPASERTVCRALEQRLPGASMRLDIARLRLDLSIPRASMDIKPRGYVPESEWDSGSSMAFANYDASFYRSDYSSSGYSSTSDYGYLGLNSGINLGLWRLRNQSSYRYSDAGYGSDTEWDSIRTYAQRALPGLRSELTLGDSYTSGNLIGSMAFRGVQLASDERMLPDAWRNYAPEIRGVATTNARVVVSQNGQKVYETSVPPGPFVINDLNATNSLGDLDVEVIEADGTRSTFTVPFSSVPTSMRPGQSRYSVSLGQARYYGDGNDLFGDVTYERGLTNSITLNTGARVAEDYLAVLGGGVLATRWGAFGLNSTYSTAEVEDGKREQGWRLGLDYSRTFQPTNTTLTLAGYRYSTEGFRDLTDVLGARAAESDGTTWDSASYRQRNQFTLMVNQQLGGYGNLYLSGSSSDYYDGKSRDNQLQFGYSNTWRNLSYTLSYTKQKTTRYDDRSDDPRLPPDFDRHDRDSGTNNNTLTLSLSMPLGSSSRAPYLSSSVSQRSGDTQGTSYQAGLNGSLGDTQPLSYGLSASRDSEGNGTDWSGNLQKQMPSVTLGGSYSQGRDYWQASASARGAAVVHGGGLTLGPYLGDTFALVEAKGAKGANVRGGQGSRIDGSGYAVVPWLNPYHYNSIGLDPQGIDAQAELLETERKVAPYAGATLKVAFKTLSGHAMLIRGRQADGSPLPLGANVLDEQGASIGMVGQGGQVYARAEADKGRLTVQWGDGAGEQCQLPYDLKGQDGDKALIRLEATCSAVR